MKSEDIVGKVTHIETIAEGSRIRELLRLRRVHGEGRWKKKKGGKVEYKIKHPIHDK